MVITIMIIGAFITYYIQYNKNWYKIDEWVKKDSWRSWEECPEFWKIVLKSVFWYIWLIIYIIWAILDKTIGKKYFEKNFEKSVSESEVIAILDELLQRPDILIDAVTNENTIYDAEGLYFVGKEYLK